MKLLTGLRKGIWPTLLAILALGLLTYLPYIFQLGFYQDDWPNLYFQFVQGNEGTWLFHAYDGRPLSGWFYQALFPLLGYRPLTWQVFTLAARLLTTFTLVLVLLEIWPAHRRSVTLTALLFLVYPVFMQQPISVTFSAHWVSFFCVWLSFYLMFLSIRRPAWFWPLTILGMLVSGVGYVLEEFFIGVELLRPVLLYLYWNNCTPPAQSRARFILKYTAPYALVWFAFVVWRTELIQLPVADRNETFVLSRLLAAPLKQGWQLLQWAVQDFVQVAAFSWSKTIDPAIIEWNTPAQLAAWGMAALAAAGTFWLGSMRSWWMPVEGTPQKTFWRQALGLGVLGMLLGMAPGWLVARQVSSVDGLWNDRFGMASMWAGGLLIVAVLEAWINSPRVRLGIVAVCIGLGVALHATNLNDYRWAWTYQSRFYSQLAWRAPALEANTLILSDGEVFSKMGVYPTSFALNVLYPQSDPEQPSYWFIPIRKFFGTRIDQMLDGVDFSYEKWQARFSGNSRQSIVVRYENQENSCVWVLSERDLLNPLLSDTTRIALAASDLSRIRTDGTPGYPSAEVFGAQSTATWCYYYEKADLARQFGQWEEVNLLWDEAQSLNFSPGVNMELTPFIESGLVTGRWQQAIDLTDTIYKTIENVGPYLCSIWTQSTHAAAVPQEYQEQYQTLMDDLACDRGE